MHVSRSTSPLITMMLPVDGDTSRAASARAMSYLFLAAGVLGLIVQLVTHPSQPLNLVNAVLVVDAFALSLICARAALQLSLAALQGMLALATVMLGVAMAASQVDAGAYSFFLVWICLFAFYFFPFRHAIGHLVLAGTVLAAAFMITQHPGAVGAWLLTMGTLLVVGPLVAIVKGRIEGLIEYLAEAATTDPLTELLNRRGFDERFDHELERARRGTGNLSLLVGDLDYFKQVNDDHGHNAGDEVLVQVAQIFRDALRQIDVAARTGGEEFQILLPETDASGALHVAEKLRRMIQDHFQGTAIEITISFGVAHYGIDGDTHEELARAGDQALYAAKELGRNRSVRYSREVENVLHNAHLQRESQSRTHLATLLTLAEALDLRDSSTASHSQSVGRYAELMAKQLGCDEDLVERIRLAGVLHDIGKIGIPDSVLWKEGPLDDDEWATMKRHPEIGARILGPTDFKDIQSWVLAHHERVDGTGYPHQLAGDDIPLGARILAVADAYEAMTADRVYRSAMDPATAVEELMYCTGTHFDAVVVGAFLDVLDELESARARKRAQFEREAHTQAGARIEFDSSDDETHAAAA